PRGIADAREVVITDPITLQQSFAYVMLSAKDADGTYRRTPRSTAAIAPYVFYRRDPNADQFVYSQSAFSNYGNAPKGPVCNADGTPSIGHGFKYDALGNIVLDVTTFVQRRPLDTATVNTPRYSFRYDGRWVMDSITVSPDDKGLSTGDYGPNIVDRWKARAFQQPPGGSVPCCGYEEEATNWGGSSQLMGEKSGPVRTIRVTWGADSSTNNIRTEIFYSAEVRYQDHLRVHVIPPLDGIYVQRDMAAGRITTYRNNYTPDGVQVDGRNDGRAVERAAGHSGRNAVGCRGHDALLPRRLVLRRRHGDGPRAEAPPAKRHRAEHVGLRPRDRHPGLARPRGGDAGVPAPLLEPSSRRNAIQHPGRHFLRPDQCGRAARPDTGSGLFAARRHPLLPGRHRHARAAHPVH